MVPELEKPRITEIKVRMDCNGCVQKVKKALHGINGIYDLYIDFPQQKLTIVGWADPEKIIKAIKKTRKIATICSHTEASDPPAEPAAPAPAEGGQPANDNPNPPPTESPPAEAAPPAEPPKDPPPPPPENPAPEVKPSAVAAETAPPQQAQDQHQGPPKDVEEIHIIHHHPPEYVHGYGYGGHWSNYPSGRGFRPEPPIHSGFRPEPPVYVTHSYNNHTPSPSIPAYGYVQSPPQHIRYSHPGHYSEDYRNRSNSDGNITSIFSDENPNACRIV